MRPAYVTTSATLLPLLAACPTAHRRLRHAPRVLASPLGAVPESSLSRVERARRRGTLRPVVDAATSSAQLADRPGPGAGRDQRPRHRTQPLESALELATRRLVEPDLAGTRCSGIACDQGHTSLDEGALRQQR